MSWFLSACKHRTNFLFAYFHHFASPTVPYSILKSKQDHSCFQKKTIFSETTSYNLLNVVFSRILNINVPWIIPIVYLKSPSSDSRETSMLSPIFIHLEFTSASLTINISTINMIMITHEHYKLFLMTHQSSTIAQNLGFLGTIELPTSWSSNTTWSWFSLGYYLLRGLGFLCNSKTCNKYMKEIVSAQLDTLDSDLLLFIWSKFFHLTAVVVSFIFLYYIYLSSFASPFLLPAFASFFPVKCSLLIWSSHASLCEKILHFSWDLIYFLPISHFLFI